MTMAVCWVVFANVCPVFILNMTFKMPDLIADSYAGVAKIHEAERTGEG